MLIYVVDDEDNAREFLVDKIKKVKADAEIVSFSKAEDVITATKERAFDVLFLDIQMPKINGVELAKQIKAINPKANMILVTGYSDYMKDAFSLDASDYLLKPCTRDDVEHALDNLRYQIYVPESNIDITANCFGNFELFYKGKPIKFRYSKSKEVVAYLIDRNGAICSNNEVIAALWEDDENHSSYYRTVQKDIHDTLEKLGCEDIINRQRAGASIVKDKIRCDYYDYLDGKAQAINSFYGEYMIQYSWAEETAALFYK